MAAVVIYAPVLWAPGAFGGDMVALGFLGISLATAAGILVASGTAAIVLWLRARRAAARGSRQEG